MTTFTLDTAWLEPGYAPASLWESPFEGVDCIPAFIEVDGVTERTPWLGSLESFGLELAKTVDDQLMRIGRPIHCLLSGGYDSRILAFLLEKAGREPLYVTDGTEEPQCGDTLDLLDVPKERRYVHDMSQPDPYGLVEARCAGFAPLYSQMRFMPADPQATLVTGLGGGEWFSYPASGWHDGKRHRTPHRDLIEQWLDCWPQYTLLPDAWGRGYGGVIHPYCTREYAAVAVRCRPEWVCEGEHRPELDLVRHTVLNALDTDLAPIGWVPHEYDWRLTLPERSRIQERYLRSRVGAQYHRDEWGQPCDMSYAEHACTVAGFATWVEDLEKKGYRVLLP